MIMAYAQCTLSDHGSARGEFWGAGTVGAFEVVTYPMMPKSWMGQEYELEYVKSQFLDSIYGVHPIIIAR